jgi:hypothetical protein
VSLVVSVIVYRLSVTSYQLSVIGYFVIGSWLLVIKKQVLVVVKGMEKWKTLSECKRITSNIDFWLQLQWFIVPQGVVRFLHVVISFDLSTDLRYANVLYHGGYNENGNISIRFGYCIIVLHYRLLMKLVNVKLLINRCLLKVMISLWVPWYSWWWWWYYLLVIVDESKLMYDMFYHFITSTFFPVTV